MLSSRAYWMIMHSLFLDQLISGPSFTKGRIYCRRRRRKRRLILILSKYSLEKLKLFHFISLHVFLPVSTLNTRKI